jgi:hypothetical protein
VGVPDVKVDPVLRELAQDVGFVGAWARHAAVIPRADTGKPVPWTEPLADEDVEVMAGYVLTACLVLTCALSGMRTSELAEIEVGCRSRARTTPGGGARFRLASRVIKWKPVGGVPDEWVVIDEVDRAVGLAERLVLQQRFAIWPGQKHRWECSGLMACQGRSCRTAPPTSGIVAGSGSVWRRPDACAATVTSSLRGCEAAGRVGARGQLPAAGGLPPR